MDQANKRVLLWVVLMAVVGVAALPLYRYPWYDSVMHFCIPFLMVWFGLSITSITDAVAVLSVCMVIIYWEVFEYIHGGLFRIGYRDTLLDLSIGIAGVACGYIWESR